jgi:hypothetical protein
MKIIEHPSFMATDFSNENQCSADLFHRYQCGKNTLFGHLCHKKPGRAGS